MTIINIKKNHQKRIIFLSFVALLGRFPNKIEILQCSKEMEEESYFYKMINILVNEKNKGYSEPFFLRTPGALDLFFCLKKLKHENFI